MMFSGETDTDIMWSHNGAYVKLNSKEVKHILASSLDGNGKHGCTPYKKLQKALKFFKEMEGKK